MPTAYNDGFLQLWPTTLLQRTLPGHERANPALGALIEQLEAGNKDLTTDYLDDNLMTNEHPALQWLKDCVNKTVIDYLHRQGLDYPVNWSLHGWANINRFGDYHDLHNHPHSYLSGTYYVATPDQETEAGSRNDLSPGAISFYDPRPQANMNAIRGDAQVSPQYTLHPAPGMILMWPSFLHHLVHPNLSRQKRISISFNVVLKWSDDYLPPQN
ncbi:MAG: 2OG-Fe(II) oxygenase family protein [Gammaproteobacteria bacterium]|nr:2OG-Fe(II) oxygenase family protein [Gammaproteobacteria bacterium]MDH3450000.1 2OG-Fe(II) oxygenase family protein [Gammaproteobacteria bacterium]